MMLQLNPPLPMHVVGKGDGCCHFVIDRGPEHHLVWVIAMDDGGQWWSVENPNVRATVNWTWGRSADKTCPEPLRT